MSTTGRGKISMDKTDELLRTIAEGDAVKILSEKDLIERFNYLLQHELIAISEDAIQLTEKGKEAELTGVASVIKHQNLTGLTEEVLDIDQNRVRSKKIILSKIFRKWKLRPN